MGKKMPSKPYETNPVGLPAGKDRSVALPDPLSLLGTRDRGLCLAAPELQSMCMWRVAARSRAHLTLSPIRIYCLTSRLPEIGCSDLTLGSTARATF